MELVKGLFQSMNFKELVHFFKVLSKGGPDLKDRMDKEKKPYIFVGMVCVTEDYQGQGYMRKLMEMAGTRDFGENGKMYDLIKYPD